MQRFDSVDPLVDHCVVEAIRYVDRIMVDLAPSAVAGAGHPRDDAHTVALDMRRRLPEATRFICLQMFHRLRAFAKEADQAFHEERKAVLPKPKNHVDYTMRVIWAKLEAIVEDKYRAKADWKPLTWNPYHDLHRSLAVLEKHIATQQEAKRHR